MPALWASTNWEMILLGLQGAFQFNLDRIAALFGNSRKFPKLFPEKICYLFCVVKKYLALYWLSIRILDLPPFTFMISFSV